MRFPLSRAFPVAALVVVSVTLSARAADPAPASGVDAAVKKLPAAEKPIHLFDGKDLDGWDGAKEYWSVQDGAIRGANTSPVPSRLHANGQPQEFLFRGLVLTKDPEDKLVTAKDEAKP